MSTASTNLDGSTSDGKRVVRAAYWPVDLNSENGRAHQRLALHRMLDRTDGLWALVSPGLILSFAVPTTELSEHLIFVFRPEKSRTFGASLIVA